MSHSTWAMYRPLMWWNLTANCNVGSSYLARENSYVTCCVVTGQGDCGTNGPQPQDWLKYTRDEGKIVRRLSAVVLFPSKAEQDRDCRNGLSPEEEGEYQLLPQDRPGADLGADLIVMIGGHAKGQVPGPELLEQSRTERTGGDGHGKRRAEWGTQ